MARLPATGAAAVVMAGNPQQDRGACPDLCLNRAHTQSARRGPGAGTASYS